LKNRKVLIGIVLLLMMIAIGGIVAYYVYNNMYYVSTDDSTIQGDLIKATPQISGKLVEINIDDGDYVQKNQIIARQDMGNIPDTSLDSSIIRAPISGIVLKKTGTIGEVLSQGQQIAVMVDPGKLYVNANIEETKAREIKPGQVVDIKVDEYGNRQFKGKVKSIGKYANSDLALIPTSTSGTFTKVVQKIPVKISLETANCELLPGTNAIVKIHIK